MRKTGEYKTLGSTNYFIPYNLPPKGPELKLSPKLLSLYGEASFALGELQEMSLRLPDPDRFVKAYVIKEALLSSSIEGIHTTLIDVFTCETGDSKPDKDTQLVLNYTKALSAALSMLKKQNLPLVSRVILKAHESLMSAGESDKASPGHYRKQSVRVGKLIPPPPTEVPKLMNELEKNMNEPSELPPLIQAGLIHVQFETIHPFLDGNGRIGRLLIVLMLIHGGLLDTPILYPSYYFKKRHLEYYQRLDEVRTKGDFESWIVFFLKAIRDGAHDAHKRAKEIEELGLNLKNRIRKDSAFSKMRETANEMLDFLFAHPITGIPEASQKLGKAYNTIDSTLKRLAKLKIVSETIVRKRNKIYKFDPYLILLEKEY